MNYERNPDHKCSNSRKPHNQETCNPISCPMWETNKWSEVSAKQSQVQLRNCSLHRVRTCETSRRGVKRADRSVESFASRWNLGPREKGKEYLFAAQCDGLSTPCRGLSQTRYLLSCRIVSKSMELSTRFFHARCERSLSLSFFLFSFFAITNVFIFIPSYSRIERFFHKWEDFKSCDKRAQFPIE